MRSTAWRSGFGRACLVALATAGYARAADELIPGKFLIVQTLIERPRARLIAKPISGSFDLPTGDPRISGGTLQIFDTGGASTPMFVNLPAANWKGIGVPPGSRGYYYDGYHGAGTPADTCLSVLVWDKSVKFVCRGAGVTLDPPFAGNAAVVLTVANNTRYCAEFGGLDVRNVDGVLRRRHSPAPNACASPPAGGTTSTSSTLSTSTSSTSSSTAPSPTTSTSSTSTSTSPTITSSTSTSSSSTSTSSTTSTTIATCCNNAMAVSFLTADTPGDCGDLITAGGAPTVANLACSGLYTGGGGNSVPLPYAVPDKGFAISAITSCTGQTGTLGGTTSTQTGSNRNCTATGCLFGAPLAVPNANSTPTSVCVINAASSAASGTLVCNTGGTQLSLPLSASIYLTGDKISAQAGIQPCPTCRNPGTGNVCTGGPNNGMTCTPGTNIGPGTGDLSYPTSHDCPPDGSDFIGSLPVAFLLNSGTVTWTGTVATNDTGSTASAQTRVFSGFCRDVALPGGTGSFDISATAGGQFRQCWENGMAINAPCAETLNNAESCEQRTQGAFGPNGGANRTITVIGNSMSLLGGPSVGTLVSVFSIPPTFDATIDGAGDLPAPGAVSLVGTATLCSALNCM